MLLQFGLAAAITIFNVMFLAWLAHYIMSDDKAEIASFCFYLGGLIIGDPLRFASHEDRIVMLGGVVAGLIFVWVRFFAQKWVHQHG